MSLRARVTIIVGLIMTAVVVTVGIVDARATENTLQEQVDAQVMETAARIKPGYGKPYDGGGYNGRPGQTQESSEPTAPEFNAVAWFVYDEDGTMIQNQPCGFSDAPQSPPVMPEVPSDEVVSLLGSIQTTPSQDGTLNYRMMVRQDELNHFVFTAAPLEDAEAALDRLTRSMTLAGIAGVVLAGLGSWALITREFRPVDRMIDTAAAIGKGNLGERVPEPAAGTELGRLGRALNQMLGRIQRSSEAQAQSESRLRQFVADAAHELRSPLTSVRGYAELYRQGAFSAPDQVDGAMRRIETEGDRMGKLVDELLLLARLDQQVDHVHEPLDLSAVVADAVEAFTIIQPDRPMSTDIEPGIRIDGASAQVRQIADNLLSNVRVHTTPESAASVTLRRDGGDAVLRVRDDGPGIDPAFLPHVFERFTREDPARTRSTGGSGLGLAIVAALVESHHGTIQLESEPGKGTTFVVRFPAMS